MGTMMLTTELRNLSQHRPRFCRDRGKGWADAGALCLSLVRRRAVGFTHMSDNPDKSGGNEDRHKAPTLPPIHPLSLQTGSDVSYHSPVRLLKITRWAAVFPVIARCGRQTSSESGSDVCGNCPI